MIHPTASIHQDAIVHPGAVIGERAVIRAWAVIGERAVINTATRSDGYVFAIMRSKGAVRITAGCRDFSPAEARKHWQQTRGDTKLGRESIALVDHLERMLAIQETPTT
jgi:carbonic anhydrase/acetyltransferase-like protein (isoleucine patch superfamily)